jgi:hypothetical protein
MSDPGPSRLPEISAHAKGGVGDRPGGGFHGLALS